MRSDKDQSVIVSIDHLERLLYVSSTFFCKEKRFVPYASAWSEGMMCKMNVALYYAAAPIAMQNEEFSRQDNQ